MSLPTNTDKPVIQGELRRTPKGRNAAQYEVALEGEILDRRSSVAHEFTGALLAQSPNEKWSRLSYHGKADKLATSLRTAQRNLKWPVQYLVATLQPSSK